jgi:hypothetical protein
MLAPYPTLAQQQAIAKQIHDYFVGKGLPSFQSCGIVAQPDREASFRVHVVGDHGEATGLFQMHNDRRVVIKAGCGIDMATADVAGQCEGVWWELNNTSYRQALAHLRATTTAYDAGYAMTKYYEQPGAANQDDNGGKLAEKWFRFLNP